jgi:hypothetical protein
MNMGLRQVYIYDTDGNSSHSSTLKTRAEMVLETLVFTIQPLDLAGSMRRFYYTICSLLFIYPFFSRVG